MRSWQHLVDLFGWTVADRGFQRACASRSVAGSVVEFSSDMVQITGTPKRKVGAFGCLCVCQAAGLVVVESWVAGLGSDLSEELVVGVGPATLD
jgi:hypothetical protein